MTSPEKVLRELAENPRVSAQTIGVKLDLSKRQVERIFKQLREEGRIVREGGTRGVWKLVK